MQTYSKENSGTNTYTFKNCNFTNVHLDFEGGSYTPAYNKFVLSFTDCDFTSTLGFQQNTISTNAYTYGEYNFEKCNFVETGITIGAKCSEDESYAHSITISDCSFKSENMKKFSACIQTEWASTVHGKLDISNTTFEITNADDTSTNKAIAANCVYVQTKLNNTNGKNLNITLSSVSFTTKGNAYPYTFSTSYYDNGLKSAGKIVSDTDCSYTKDFKTIIPSAKEGEITWTTQAE